MDKGSGKHIAIVEVDGRPRLAEIDVLRDGPGQWFEWNGRQLEKITREVPADSMGPKHINIYRPIGEL